MTIFKKVTVHSYYAQYNYPNMREPLPNADELFDMARKKLNLEMYPYSSHIGYTYNNQDFSVTFNKELPLSEIQENNLKFSFGSKSFCFTKSFGSIDKIVRFVYNIIEMRYF